MKHGSIGEVFKMKTTHLQNYNDFGVKKFGSPKTNFPIWQLISIYSLTIHTSPIKRWIVELSFFYTNELLRNNIAHVGRFKLFGNKNLQMVFSYANEVFMGMISNPISWNVLFMLVKTYSCDLHVMEYYAMNKHGGFWNSCYDSCVKTTKVGIILHEFFDSHLVLFRGALVL